MQSPIDLIDKICTKCKKLESLTLDGRILIDRDEITPENPQAPTNNEEKFPNLTFISIEFFYPVNEDFCDNADDFAAEIDKKKKAMNNFQTFLTAKFPNLTHPIQVDMDGYKDDEFVLFCSRPLS